MVVFEQTGVVLGPCAAPFSSSILAYADMRPSCPEGDEIALKQMLHWTPLSWLCLTWTKDFHFHFIDVEGILPVGLEVWVPSTSHCATGGAYTLSDLRSPGALILWEALLFLTLRCGHQTQDLPELQSTGLLLLYRLCIDHLPCVESKASPHLD